MNIERLCDDETDRWDFAMNIMNLLLFNKSAVQQGLAVPLPKSNMELHVIPEVFFEVTGKSGE